MIQITINDNKEVEVKTTNGLEETELATNAVLEIILIVGDKNEVKEAFEKFNDSEAVKVEIRKV